MRYNSILLFLLLLAMSAAAQGSTEVTTSSAMTNTTSMLSNSAVRGSGGIPAGGVLHGNAVLSLADLKLKLADDGRSISGASYTELERLAESPGGLVPNIWNSEFVFRIGESTFIVNMRLISTVTTISLIVVLILFSPFGFMFFRGSAHGLIGGLLQVFRIAPDYGQHLRREPKKWLQKEASARLAFRAYMRRAFIPEYRNNITAIAFLGTAFLIMSIGFRGIKFMVPHQPELIIIAIIVEITVLCMLGLSTWYERADDDAAAPTSDAVRLPNGEYIEREYVMQALRTVVEDLNAATAAEKAAVCVRGEE